MSTSSKSYLPDVKKMGLTDLHVELIHDGMRFLGIDSRGMQEDFLWERRWMTRVIG